MTSPIAEAFEALKSFRPAHDRMERGAKGKGGGKSGGKSGAKHGGKPAPKGGGNNAAPQPAPRGPHSDQAAGIAAGLTDTVLRHSPLIEHLIAHVSTVRPNKMEREVLAAVSLGVASHLRGVPAYAAVSESVSLLPREHRARGLVNAVMRRVTETISSRLLTDDERAGLLACDAGTIAQLVTPTRIPFLNQRLLETRFDLFGANPRAALPFLSGLPDWLVAKLAKSLDEQQLTQVCLAAASAPAVWLRVPAGREDEAAAALADTPHGRDNVAIRLEEQGIRAVLHHPAFAAGALTVQDATAQLVVKAAPPSAGSLCADFCAAPGGKTAQIAEATGSTGRVVAVDVSESKLNKVRETITRLRLSNINGVVGDARTATLPDAGKYDYALVDAPCSNTGVLARRVEVRSRLREKDFGELAVIQLAALANAARHVRSGGTLVYSTCSLVKEENGDVVRAFLAGDIGAKAGWNLKSEHLSLPTSAGHDGGYFAVLVRTAAL